MSESEYETIEHDFITTKDNFNNVKFAYKERISKLFFYEALISNNYKIYDSPNLLSSSKEQLVEIKKEYEVLDENIKNLSTEIFNMENHLNSEKALLKDLNSNLSLLISEKNKNNEIYEKLLLNNNLNEEFEKVENEIKELSKQIENSKNCLERDVLGQKLNEEKELKKNVKDLNTKIKRLTIINTENDIEEIFFWYKNLISFYENIFGKLKINIKEEKCVIEINSKRNIEIILKDKRLIDIKINDQEDLEKIKEYCIKLNDPRLILSEINKKELKEN